MSKRVVFTFDDASYEDLERIVANGNFRSMADAVRCSLMIVRALQSQAEAGYDQVFVKGSRGTREMIIPNSLSRGRKCRKQKHVNDS